MTEAITVKKGKRYTPQEKAEAIAFVAEYNKANKRGGQKAAAEKFGITTLTISNWLKAAKSKGAAKKPDAVAAPKVAKKKAGKRGRPSKKQAAKRGRPPKSATAGNAPAKKTGAKRGRPAAIGFTAKLNKLVSLNDEIAKTEAGLSKLKAEFAKLKASL